MIRSRRIFFGVAVLVAALAVIARARDGLSGTLAELNAAAGDVHYTKLVPDGERVTNGLYDPSVAYTGDGREGWLAYSSVEGDQKPVGAYVHTHLAHSTNGGASWQFVKVVNASSDDTLRLPDGTSLHGRWRYEVPTLVRDEADPDASRHWKLFTHQYFSTPTQDRMVTYGWIAVRTAADPAGAWSASMPLFGAGHSPAAPYDKTRVNVNALDASLRNAVAYSEPGALAHDGRLFLSMTALIPRLSLRGVGVDHVIVLLTSDDHGTSWRFTRTLLTRDDAQALGCDYFDGSSLAEEAGRFFLLAAPMVQGKTELHYGTAALEFASLAEGRLARDQQGRPTVAAYFPPQPSLFSGPGAGQATYDSHNTSGGLLMPQFNLHAFPEVFQLYQTGRWLPGKK